MDQKESYLIRQERPEDYKETENLTREAFWNVYRPGCTEHYILHCFRDREDFVPELDLVLEKDGRIIGHIMYVRSKIQADDGQEIPVMTFGPVSIAPEWQRKGYGKLLLDASMEKAKAMGVKALCIEGNIAFYGKSGFVLAGARGISEKPEDRETISPYFLLKELEPDALKGVTGVYCTPEGYFVDENQADAFDALFPPKEKKTLPGQLV